MKWSHWTGLLMVGLFGPAVAIGCTAADTKDPLQELADASAAVGEVPAIPAPSAEAHDADGQVTDPQAAVADTEPADEEDEDGTDPADPDVAAPPQ